MFCGRIVIILIVNSRGKRVSVKGKRWLFALNGVLAMLFMGLIYAWSVFVGPLEGEFGWQRNETSLVFSISMAFFCLGGFGGGLLSKKFSPRIVMLGAAVFVLGGFSLASTISSLIGLYLCYGVMCGFGVGMGYNAILNSVLRWFPDKQGTVSGVLLMGFGFGGMVLGTVAVQLMDTYGWRGTFVSFGVALSVLLAVATLFMRLPTAEQISEIGGGAKKAAATQTEDVPTLQMVKSRNFVSYFMWAGFFAAVGLAIIGVAAAMAGSMTENLAQAAFVAGLLNIFNGIGRVVAGILFDTIGSKKCLWLYSGALLLTVLILMGAIMTNSLILLGVGFVAVGLCYGGVPTFNSAYVSRMYGTKYYPINLSVMNLQLILSAFLGPYSAGIAQSASGGGYFSTMVLMAIFCVVCGAILLLIKKHVSGRNAAK